MERYQKGPTTEFWNEFSDDDGKRMSFTEISIALRNQRDTHAVQLAKEARQRYSKERFAVLFSYKKSGQTRVKTKDAEIAKTYEKLLAEGITQ